MPPNGAICRGLAWVRRENWAGSSVELGIRRKSFFFKILAGEVDNQRQSLITDISEYGAE